MKPLTIFWSQYIQKNIEIKMRLKGNSSDLILKITFFLTHAVWTCNLQFILNQLFTGQPDDISLINEEFLLVLERDGLKIFSLMGVFIKSVSTDFRRWQNSSETLNLSVINSFVYSSAICCGIAGLRISM